MARAKKTDEVASVEIESTKAVEEEISEATSEVAETAEKAPAKRARRTSGASSKTASSRSKKEVAHKTVLQCAAGEFDVDDIVKRAESAFKEKNKRKRYDEFSVYIKPEEGMAYYAAKYGDKMVDEDGISL